MSSIDLVAFDWGRLRDRRHGAARLLRAAEMRLKTSGSDASGPAASGGGGGGLLCWGGGGGGEPRGAGGAHVGTEETSAPAGTGPELSISGLKVGGRTGPAPPPPPMCWPHTHRAPPGQPGG